MNAALWHARLALLAHRADRVFHSVALLWLGLLLLLPLARDLTLGAPSRGAVDVGLLLVWAGGALVATWMGVRAVGAPLRDRSAVVFLAPPSPLGAWVVGRWLGGAAATALWLAAALLGFWLTCAWVGASAPPLAAYALALLVELLVIQSLASLLSTAVRPLLAATLTFGLVAVGHLGPAFRVWADEVGVPLLAAVAYRVLPDLARLDLHAHALYGTPPSTLDLAARLAYGALWTLVFLAGTALAVHRRDLA